MGIYNKRVLIFSSSSLILNFLITFEETILYPLMSKQKIALVLSTGGARGIAHIGAIEELERHGFEISSIAGCSMGALIGAAYATGQLPACKQLLLELDKRKMFGLADVTLARDGFLKGERVMRTLSGFIPDIAIEELPIPFSAVATDIQTEREVVINSGRLYDAIRASISIPMVFRPFRLQGMALTDGGMINPLPLDRVVRTEGDMLVAVMVSMLPMTGDESQHQPPQKLNPFHLLTQSSTIMIQKIARLSIEHYQPDLLISVPCRKYSIFQFHQSEGIIAEGVRMSRKAIEAYLNTSTPKHRI